MNRVKSTGLQGFIVAMLIHAVGIGGLFVISPPERARAGNRSSVKVRLASRPEPPVPKSPPPESPDVREPILVEPKKPLKKKVMSPKKAQVSPKEPVASVTSQKPVDPLRSTVPRKFTVAMEATVPAGGVAVPTATGEGWSFGAPDGEEQAEKVLAGPAIKKKKTPVAVEAAGVTRLPQLVSQPSRTDMRLTYPEEARRSGEEANVYLKILINAKGLVSKVRVIRSAGAGFDRAARQLVNRFRFRPGEVDGLPVAVWIPWTYKFRLEG